MDAQTKGNARAVCLEQSASAPAHKEAKKWKTPYERALERVCATLHIPVTPVVLVWWAPF